MTQSFALNGNNDIFIGADGNLAVASGIDAVLYACANAAQTRLGEMPLATGKGLPFFEAVWNGTPNYALYESFLREAITAVDGVVSIQQLDIAAVNNTLRYTITIQTAFGTGTING